MIFDKPSRLPRLKRGSWVSLDTEDSGLYPDDGARVSVVSVAWFCADQIDRPCTGPCDEGVHGGAFPFAHGVEIQPWFNGAFTLFGGDEDINLPASEWNALVEWLSVLRIAMHNAQYDLIMMDAGTPDFAPCGPQRMRLDERVEWDTMLGTRNIWPTEPKSLDSMATRLKLGKKLGDPVKDWIRKNKAQYVKQGYPTWGSGYDLMPWAPSGDVKTGMRKYAVIDAILTLKGQRVQEAMFADGYGDFAEFSGKQMDNMRQFVKMERRGMPFPRTYSAGFVGILEAKQHRVGRELPFTPTKDGAVKFFFTEEPTARGVNGLGLIPRAEKVGQPSKKWPEGAPSLDAEVLSDLAEEEVPHAKAWKLHTDLGRLASMYYGGYAEKTGADGRLRARIRQLREETRDSDHMADRFSIERVNLQAMPHDGKLKQALEGLDVPSVRGMIAYEVEKNYEGWELWEFDLSQAELRVGALLSDCKRMLNAFREGKDLHQMTAELVGVPRNPVAKSSNFLLIFDGGWQTFQRQVKKQTLSNPNGPTILTAKQAKDVVYPWKRTYPEFKRMADHWEKFAQTTGYVPLANGQLRWFTWREDKRKAWNQRVQGSIAQIFQEWLLTSEAVCEEAGVHERAMIEGIGGAGPLMTVHDSIICLLPADTAKKIGQKIMDAAMRLWDDYFPGVPGAVDAKQFS